VQELPQLYTSGFDPRKIYIYHAMPEDYLIKGRSGQKSFDKQDYYSNPDKYTSLFHERVLPFTTVLINGIYWEAKYPKLVSNEQLKAILAKRTENIFPLVAVADISCDIEGSLEFMNKVTTIDKPFCYLNPERFVEGGKMLFDEPKSMKDIQIMSIDNLPAELPRDASMYFGSLLAPYLDTFLKDLVKNKTLSSQDHNTLTDHKIMQNAFITLRGKLISPRFDYLEKEMKKALTEPPPKGSTDPTIQKSILMLGAGLVSGPVIQYFGGKPGYIMTLAASANLNTKLPENVSFVPFDVESQGPLLETLVKQHDITIR